MPSDEPKQQKQESIQQPWGPSQPGLKKSISDATSLYNSGGLQFDFPTNTVAAPSPETTDFWSMTADRARAGSANVDAAQGYNADVLGGKYLGADAPGLQGVLDRARAGVNANYSVKGRYGSEAHDDAVTSALSPFLFDNYARERGAMDTAAGMAPGLANQDYVDLDKLGQVGAQRGDYAQRLTDQEAARQQWEQQKKANAIALYQSLLGGTYGGSTTASGSAGPGTNWGALAAGAAAQLGSAYLGAG